MEAILKTYPVGILKSEISKANIKGYSKLKKADIIKLMINQQATFKHLLKNDTYRKKNPEDRSRQSKNHATPQKTILAREAKKDLKKQMKPPKKVRIKIKKPDTKVAQKEFVKKMMKSSEIFVSMTILLDTLGMGISQETYDKKQKELEKKVKNNIEKELKKLGSIDAFEKKYKQRSDYDELMPKIV